MEDSSDGSAAEGSPTVRCLAYLRNLIEAGIIELGSKPEHDPFLAFVDDKISELRRNTPSANALLEKTQRTFFVRERARMERRIKNEDLPEPQRQALQRRVNHLSELLRRL